jgi:hypothetical protein
MDWWYLSLAEKAGLPDPCYHEDQQYLSEIIQVKVLASVIYLPSLSFSTYLNIKFMSQ